MYNVCIHTLVYTKLYNAQAVLDWAKLYVENVL